MLPNPRENRFWDVLADLGQCLEPFRVMDSPFSAQTLSSVVLSED